MKRIPALLLCAFLMGEKEAKAQTVTTTPSTEFDRHGIWRTLFGDGWRDVWATPIQVRVLNLATYAGGLEPFKQGGNQSKTLRFHAGDGRTYIFRTTYKNVEKSLPKDLKKTLMGEIIQDQTGSFHPTGLLAVDVLADAVGVLHAPTELYFMPDDPRLGKYRDDFKNMLGTIEERPEDSEKGKTFADAKDIESTEDLMMKLEESTKNKVDARDYLTARLLDFLIGDVDRGADNWRWAEYDAPGGGNIYRPIPRDRDYAFMHIEGMLPNLAAKVYPKLTEFRNEFPKIRTLTFMSAEFDRSHLVELPWSEWQATVSRMQNALTNDVIDRAIARIPPEHRAISEQVIRDGLRSRRDGLLAIAQEYYHTIAQNADVFASDDDERAEITQHDDGSVTVQLFRKSSDQIFNRRFLPQETQDIRVYLDRGNDQAIVRGSIAHSIKVRVVGGEGDDVLVDSSAAGARFYDATGQNTFVRGANTAVDTKPYQTMQPARFLDSEDEKTNPDKNPHMILEERRGRHQDLQTARADFVAQKTTAATVRTWGKKAAWTPLIDFQDGPGVILGFGPIVTDYGFRRPPFETQLMVRGLVGLNGGYGAEAVLAQHWEQSPWSLSVVGRATTRLDSNRFFGFGNNTPFISDDSSIVLRKDVMVSPALNYSFDKNSRLAVGPVIHYVNPDGFDDRADVGVRAELGLLNSQRDQVKARGVDFIGGGSVYDRFQEAHVTGHAYLGLGRGTLALRAAGRRVWGDFPLNEAALLGGIESLRGYRWNRFAGDASLFGTAEVRFPVTRIKLLTAGDLGVIGFSDVGRVWYHGDSPGTWHDSQGAGVWFGTLGQVVSLTYAKGEQGRVNFSIGFPF